MSKLNELIDHILVGKARTPEGLVSRARKWRKNAGIEADPFGVGNKKTGVPSTYRKVGPTCPVTCPWLENGCYAQDGKVKMASDKSSDDTDRSLMAAAGAMATAAKLGTVARLHVSGDFLRDGKVDVGYVLGLLDIAEELQDRGYEGIRAWAYTHIPPSEFEPYRALLQGAVEVLYSDVEEAGGAVVWEHSRIDELKARNPDVQVVKCLAQTTGGSRDCKSCGLCWKARDNDWLIAFDPHGPRVRKVRETLAS
jgi:hypothetical protein